jgi:hypothetical protein
MDACKLAEANPGHCTGLAQLTAEGQKPDHFRGTADAADPRPALQTQAGANN